MSVVDTLDLVTFVDSSNSKQFGKCSVDETCKGSPSENREKTQQLIGDLDSLSGVETANVFVEKSSQDSSNKSASEVDGDLIGDIIDLQFLIEGFEDEEGYGSNDSHKDGSPVFNVMSASSDDD